MVCAGERAVSVLKFVGTASLGLLTVSPPPARALDPPVWYACPRTGDSTCRSRGRGPAASRAETSKLPPFACPFPSSEPGTVKPAAGLAPRALT